MSLGYSISALFAMLLAVLTGARIIRTKLTELIDYSFLRLIILISIYCVLDAFWGIFYFGNINNSSLFIIVCYAVYLMSGVVTLVWFYYIISSIGGGTTAISILRTIAVILMIFQLLLLITNEFTHDLFFVSSEGVYHSFNGRIQLQLLQALNYFIAFVYGIFRLIVGKKEDQGSLRIGILYSVLPGLFGAGQILLIDVSMYSLGFALSIFSIFLFDKSRRMVRFVNSMRQSEREEQLSIINSIAGDFSTIYSVDMETGGFIIYNRTSGESLLQKYDNSNLDYFKVAVDKGRKMIHEDDLENFLLIMNRDAIKRRFESNTSFSLTLRIKLGNDIKYIQYKFTDNFLGSKERVIISVYDVDKAYRKRLRDKETLKNAKERQMALEEEAQLLDIAAHRDIMTGLYNRRAYEDHIQECHGVPDGEDFVYASLDINGLKAVNDDIGHEAGDELIKGAAFCMKKVLGEYGCIYRHGGDEFSAILHVPTDKVEKLFECFDKELENYRVQLIDEISVSYGYVTAKEAGNVSIEELANISDKRMYEAKSRHYAKKGIDRRGQQEAYDAIRKSYIKILKVDLKSDSFASVYMDESESSSDKGYSTSLSKWLHDFATSGNVHPDDLEKFVGSLDLDKIRTHFENRHKNIAIHYRRKNKNGYNNALLEIIPSDNFTKDSQIVYLYVKNIH